MGGCMGQKVGSGQMTNLIKLELINIIWFSLKIYNLLRHPYLWVDGYVNGWAHVKPLKSNKSWPYRDNSIMDILYILLDILLKPPQPLMGLFLTNTIMDGQRRCGKVMFSVMCMCQSVHRRSPMWPPAVMPLVNHMLCGTPIPTWDPPTPYPHGVPAYRDPPPSPSPHRDPPGPALVPRYVPTYSTWTSPWPPPKQFLFNWKALLFVRCWFFKVRALFINFIYKLSF